MRELLDRYAATAAKKAHAHQTVRFMQSDDAGSAKCRGVRTRRQENHVSNGWQCAESANCDQQRISRDVS